MFILNVYMRLYVQNLFTYSLRSKHDNLTIWPEFISADFKNLLSP
jgi:hypothetical protein